MAQTASAADTWERPVVVFHAKSGVAERVFIEGDMADHFMVHAQEKQPSASDVTATAVAPVVGIYLAAEHEKATQELQLAQELLRKGEQAFVEAEITDAQIGLELAAQLLTQHLDQGARLVDAARAHAILGALFVQEGNKEAAQASFADALSLLPTMAPPDFFGDEERALFSEVAESLAFSRPSTLIVENGPFEVWVDGRFVGVSPLRQPFAPGLHAVTLRRLHEERQTQLVRLESSSKVRVQGPRNKLAVESLDDEALAAMKLTLSDPVVDERLLLRGIDPKAGVWLFRVFRYAEQRVVEAAFFDGSGVVRRAQISAERRSDLKSAMRTLRASLQVQTEPSSTPTVSDGEEALPPAVLWGAIGGAAAVTAATVIVTGAALLWSAQPQDNGDDERRATGAAAARQTVLGF